MAEFEHGMERLDQALQDIEASLSGTEEVSRAFRSEMDDMRVTMASASREAAGLSKTVGSSLKRSFDALIFDGAKLSDVLNKLGTSIANKAFNAAITPVTNALGNAVTSGVQGLFSAVTPFANGGVMAGGRVQAFADGGIVSRATAFPMRGGTGLMGEAGPEAIMPLARGADGKLGVRSAGGTAPVVNITMNISTPDLGSFQRSQSQIAAQVSRAIARGNRNL